MNEPTKLKKFENESFVDILKQLGEGLLTAVSGIGLGFLQMSIICLTFGVAAEKEDLMLLLYSLGLLVVGLALTLDNTIKLFSKIVDNTLFLLDNKVAGTSISAELSYAKLGISQALTGFKKYLDNLEFDKKESQANYTDPKKI